MSPLESVELRLRAGGVLEPETAQEQAIIDRMWDEGRLNIVFLQGECVGYRLRQNSGDGFTRKSHLL